MKMKEVTEKTNLTERAVRLYIESGLIAPSVNESYSGRRNIDFSAEDVEVLRRISVLRKAGFTISQIRQMREESEKCKEILEGFIDKTNRRIESDREMVLCLEPLLRLDSLDMESISGSLERAVAEEKELPAEDREPSVFRRITRKVFLALSALSFAVSLISCGVLMRIEITYIRRYLYPEYVSSGILFVFVLIISLLFPVTVILINCGRKSVSDKHAVIKVVTSVIMACISLYCSWYTGVLALLNVVSFPEAVVVSHTEDVENYMVFDAGGAREALSEFLPEEIPGADNVRYDYYYKESVVWNEPSETRVFIELSLDEKSYSETVEYYKKFRPTDSESEPWEESGDWRGKWTVVCYREKYEHAPSNYTPVFAYNNEEHKVRLICFYGRVSMKGAIYPLGEYDWE